MRLRHRTQTNARRPRCARSGFRRRPPRRSTSCSSGCWQAPFRRIRRTHLPLVRQFLRLTGQARPRGVDFFCDASVLAHAGVASVVFGPGDIAQAHTANEWISVRALEMAPQILTRFLRSLP